MTNELIRYIVSVVNKELDMKKEIIVKILENGQWYATLNGKHLTAQETQTAIMRGATYKIVPFDK